MRAVDMGRANAETIELTRRHCRHARIEQVGGNSFVGNALGLPMGLMEVRCEHAQPPRTQGHQALDLAVEFYNENCVDCVHREGSGELPNLKTVAGEVAARETELRDAEERAASERAGRLNERRDRRQAAMAGQDAVARELAAQLDVLDRAEPRTGPPSAGERRAERHVVETARAAPDLFGPVLVDTLLGLASDTADPTAFAALRQYRSTEAGELLAFLRPELVAADLPDVVDRLIDLASGDAYDHWRPPAAPDGLRAAAEVDLPLVTGRITEHMESDDEWTRHIAADAARVVLRQDPTRVVARCERSRTGRRLCGVSASFGSGAECPCRRLERRACHDALDRRGARRSSVARNEGRAGEDSLVAAAFPGAVGCVGSGDGGGA